MGLIDTAVVVELAQALAFMVGLIACLWVCAWVVITTGQAAWRWLFGRVRQ